MVIGKSAATTDAMGRFSIADVTAPYDIAVVASIGQVSDVTVFSRIARADPKLFSLGPTPALYQATVTGNLSGNIMLPTNLLSQRAGVLFSSPDTGESGSAQVIDSPYSTTVSWSGTNTTTGTVHVLQWNMMGGKPTTYVGYGRLANVLVANGSTAAMKDVQLNTVPDLLVTGTIDVPAGFTVNDTTIDLIFGKAAMELGGDLGPTSAFSYHAPAIAESTLRVKTLATAADGRSAMRAKLGLAAGAMGVALDLPTPASSGLPVQAASGIDLATQSFSWSAASPAGLYVLQLELGQRFRLYIITDANEAKVPSTSDLGLGTIASDTAGRWLVAGYDSNEATVDALTGAAQPYDALIAHGQDLRATSSGQRTFTTK
ncbi:MAG: hypothetical protein IPJ65_31920 [Archangiaceae bacterium]|nr:hypothetical protein [Archangiaceae bacterium]